MHEHKTGLILFTGDGPPLSPPHHPSRQATLTLIYSLKSSINISPYCFSCPKEPYHETSDNHRRDPSWRHFPCPIVEADFSGEHSCQWGDHSCLVEYLWLYYPCCAGFHAVAGE